jgi:hypothetical protein
MANASSLLARVRAKINDPAFRRIAGLFCIVTALFVLLHHARESWDFPAYVLNGEYWFKGGQYFEPLRPPLMPFALGILRTFLSRPVTEHFFLVLASLLFAYSSIALARALKFDSFWFYALSANAFVLTFGLFNGTELLTLAFLELALAGVIAGKQSGVWVGLSALSRYTSLVYLPIVLFQRKLTRIFLDVLLIGLTFLPWLAYNHLKFGHMLLSIADHYAINIYFREYLVTPFVLKHVLEVSNLLTPFAVIGLAASLIAAGRSKKAWHEHRPLLALLYIAGATMFLYATTPVKTSRYLFPLFIPIVVWAYSGIRLCARRRRQLASFAMAGLFVINMGITFHDAGRGENNPALYRDAIADVRALGYGNCSIASNGWVMLTYHGLLAQDPPRRELLNATASSGELVLLFPHIGEPDYARDDAFIAQFPVVKRTNRYILLGNGCNPVRPNDGSYVRKLADSIESIHGYRTEERPCHLLLKNGLLQKFCEVISLQGGAL